ncbi:MAG: class II glutamine amidotransferase [Firmicutes bacterium]|nr:class II glutamine amidotransferase [Bacillota bacterium]
MCELFGVTSKKEIYVNEYLTEFMSHGWDHPNGWGMAIFYGEAVSLEKEPITSNRSRYLQERLKHPFYVKNMIAHIRLATKGKEAYENTHPFVKRDKEERAWTLAHNGTIFHGDILDPYVHVQEGTSDSERILCFLKERISLVQEEQGRIEDQEKFRLVEEIVYTLSHHNKLNLLIYDGEYLYVHTNYKNSLHQKRLEDGIVFSTVPLDKEEWELHPFCQLMVYKEGQIVYKGSKETKEYIDNPEDMRFIFLDSAAL